jgi:hypothetical protein
MGSSTTREVTKAGVLIICVMVSLPMKAEQRVFDTGAGVLHDTTLLVCFAHLMSEARYGFASVERAAFLVLDADRSVRCIDWPPMQEFKEARWNGPIPNGTVAIAHTHPFSSPYPSPDDRREARHIGMPIFVLSPQIITLIHRDGREETLACCKVWLVSDRKSR